jgi:hypothetical protein
MIDQIRELATRIKAWWESLDSEKKAPRTESKVLTYFRPDSAAAVPKALQQVAAVSALATIIAAGGLALLSLSGLLVSLFVIYFLVTEVLGLEFEIDPRLWQAL